MEIYNLFSILLYVGPIQSYSHLKMGSSGIFEEKKKFFSLFVPVLSSQEQKNKIQNDIFWEFIPIQKANFKSIKLRSSI
jgi:hypothetical protein